MKKISVILFIALLCMHLLILLRPGITGNRELTE